MPGSRDEVRAMLERQRAQLDRLGLAQRRRLYRILEARRQELLDQLASVQADTFTAQH
ncbi:MAG: hypothetical protein AMXMBFR64_23720 [Myxococcales bacterium]